MVSPICIWSLNEANGSTQSNCSDELRGTPANTPATRQVCFRSAICHSTALPRLFCGDRKSLIAKASERTMAFLSRSTVAGVPTSRG